MGVVSCVFAIRRQFRIEKSRWKFKFCLLSGIKKRPYGKPFVTKIKLLRQHIVSLYGTIESYIIIWAQFDFGLYGHYILRMNGPR